MSDLISRQMAIDRINKQREHLRPDMYPQDKIGDAAYRICAEFIERLPSAEQKKGEWKHYGDKEWLRDDGTPVFILCSECNNYVLNNASSNWNYCPNCGADMRGGC